MDTWTYQLFAYMSVHVRWSWPLVLIIIGNFFNFDNFFQMNQMIWYVCEFIIVVSLCCLSKIVVSRVFSWLSFLSSKAFCSLLEDHWSMFVIWHLDIFMESHFWLFMIVAKTLLSWRKLMVHLSDKRFSWVKSDYISDGKSKHQKSYPWKYGYFWQS